MTQNYKLRSALIKLALASSFGPYPYMQSSGNYYYWGVKSPWISIRISHGQKIINKTKHISDILSSIIIIDLFIYDNNLPLKKNP